MWDIDNFLSREDFVVNALGRFRMTSLEMNPYEYPKATGYFIPNERHINCRCVVKTTHDPIDRVIFNDPATIVYWKDGSKTVVKCGPDDTFDAEKGLAMAIAKKYLGNHGNYNRILRKHLKEEKKR